MNALTDELRKRLTLFIGECYHEWSGGVIVGGKSGSEIISSSNFVCSGKCKKIITLNEFYFHGGLPPNRTFTTDADMLAVYRAIQKAGRWDVFWRYACTQCDEEVATEAEIAAVEIKTLDATLRRVYGRFTEWLFCLSNPAEIPDRMRMVGEWLDIQVPEPDRVCNACYANQQSKYPITGIVEGCNCSVINQKAEKEG